MNSNDLGFDGYWISPKGNISPVTFCRHSVVAQEILSAMGKNDVELEKCEKMLEKFGYLHIGLNYINSSYNDITDEQVTALFDLMSKCGAKMYSAIDSYIRGE